jgi:hypothetical protein
MGLHDRGSQFTLFPCVSNVSFAQGYTRRRNFPGPSHQGAEGCVSILIYVATLNISKGDRFSIRVVNQLQDENMPLSTSVVCVLLILCYKVSDTFEALAWHPPVGDKLGRWCRVHHSMSDPPK